MSITLTHPTAGAGSTPLALTLPADLIWANEFAWRKVEQTTDHTTTGALLVEQWTRQAGRPMELRGDVDYGWVLRGPLNTLNIWAGQTGLQLQLDRNGQPWSVIFDHQAGAIEATQIVPYADPVDADPYSLVLRFLILDNA